MQFWLLKTEPRDYSWEMLEKEQTTKWDGVRNFEARNYMKKMELNDFAFFYHTGAERKIIGLTKVVKTYYNDPKDSKFGIVEVSLVKSCKKQLSLDEIKLIPELQNMVLLKRGRLSVMPVTKAEADFIFQKTGL